MSEEPRRMEGDPGEPQHGVPRVGVAESEEPILSSLAAGRRVLEIGTGLGYSTRALASTAALVVTVDVDPWVHRTIWPGLTGVVCSERWPEEEEGKFDLVFVDAEHSKSAVAEDTRRAVARLAPGGMILYHDWSLPEVRLGATPVLEGAGLRFHPLTTHYGMCVAELP